MTWLDRLIRWPEILDLVAKLLGPNILCWSTSLLTREPRGWGSRELAPGSYLLVTIAQRCSHRLTGLVAGHPPERLHADAPGLARISVSPCGYGGRLQSAAPGSNYY